MHPVLPLAAAFAGGALAALASLAAPRGMRRRHGVTVSTPIVVAAMAGAVARAALTTSPGIDFALAGGIGVLSTWGAARSAHRVLAVYAVALTALLSFSPVVAGGAGIAMGVVFLRARMPPLKAAAGGLLGLGLLTEVGQEGPSWREIVALAAMVAVAGAAARRTSSRASRVFAFTFAAALSFVVGSATAFLVFAIPAARDLQRAAELTVRATHVLKTPAGQDISASLVLASGAFAQARDRLSGWPARLADAVPGVAQNAEALRTLSEAGHEVATAFAVLTAATSDLDMAAGRVDLRALEKAGREVGQARLAALDATRDLRAVRSRSLLPPIADAAQGLRERLTDGESTLAMLERALDHLPGMLGGDGPRRYLLALQTPAELRAAGGIIGAFGVLEVDQGRLGLTRTGTAGHLNDEGDPNARTVEGAEQFTRRYGRFLPLRYWQNLTMTPDWPTVGLVAKQLFPQSGGQPIDGVIGLDPSALAALLSAAGPIVVPPWPVPLSGENARRVLLYEQYLHFPNPERREFLGDVTAAVFSRLTGQGVPLPALAASLAPVLRTRNVQIWAADPGEQLLLEELTAAGAFPSGIEGSDLLAVVNQNSSANKIDWFLHRKTSYDFSFDPMLGRVDARLRIELRNDAPSTGLPHYVIGSDAPPGSRTAPGENRTLTSVYTPLRLESAALEGHPLEMEQDQEFGQHVYSAFVTVPPGGTRTLELRLSGPLDQFGSVYRLLLRSQVLPNPELVTVRARFANGWVPTGATREEFELTRDRPVEFGFRAADD